MYKKTFIIHIPGKEKILKVKQWLLNKKQNILLQDSIQIFSQTTKNRPYKHNEFNIKSSL